MHVLVTCKYEEDPIKNEGARVDTTFSPLYCNSMVAMETSGRIWPNFELIQALIHVLITCKYEKNPIKVSGENVMTLFSPLQVYGDFSRRSRAANSAVLGPIWPNFELVRDVMDVLVTCKYEEDPIKNESARVDTTFSPL